MLVTQSVNLLSEQNSKIRYTLTNSCLGSLLVASTDKGICAICLGDHDAVLEVSLAQKFPHREIKLDEIGLIPLVSQILAYLRI
jgi:AraC family transcriptional regulator of adaptative response/methylated-DNA-[protein]-cysteine methyltransferase